MCSAVGNRVRCDLKDLPFSSTGTQPQCSNCKERGLKCVSVCHLYCNPPHPRRSLHPSSDEFAEVKAVKLLRRGRRLQQVESVYTPSFVLLLCSTLPVGPSMVKLSMRRAVSLPPPPCRLGSSPDSSQNSSHLLSSVDSTSSVSHLASSFTFALSLLLRPLYRSCHRSLRVLRSLLRVQQG